MSPTTPLSSLTSKSRVRLTETAKSSSYSRFSRAPPMVGCNGGGPALSTIATNNGWQHIIIPAASMDGGNIANWANIIGLELDVYDGNYTNAKTMMLGYAN